VINAPLRDRLYSAYVSQHAGRAGRAGGGAAALIYRRDIRPALPPPGQGPVADIGCGQGELVRLLLADGYDAEGIDISPEQISLAGASGVPNLTRGDLHDLLRAHPGRYAAVTATDVLEHLTKPDVLATFDDAVTALAAGGVFIARVPNAVSPLGGHTQHGDFTHESSFTARSVRQLCAAAGLDLVAVLPCPPPVHGVLSAARAALWKPISACYRLALAAETGVLTGHIVTQNLTFVARKPASGDC